jgi:hypothetical protein
MPKNGQNLFPCHSLVPLQKLADARTGFEILE